MKIADARDSWFRALRAEGASPKTIETYAAGIDGFTEHLRLHYRPTDVAKVTRADVQAFLTHVQDTSSQGTAHNRFRVLRSFFNYVSDGGSERVQRREPLGIIDRSPMHRMAPPKLEDKPVELLTPNQIEQLWGETERPGKDFTARRDAAVVRMFLATGIRREEMVALRLEDLKLNQQLAYVSGKGRKFRYVPYSGPAATALDRYLATRSKNKHAERTERVWLGRYGPTTDSGVRQIVKSVGKRVGIHLYPHQLRHVFVDACFSQGMSEGEVMSLMGWSTAAMCRRYASARRAQRAIDTYRRLGIGDPYKH